MRSDREDPVLVTGAGGAAGGAVLRAPAGRHLAGVFC
jgi:hypothetical protein